MPKKLAVYGAGLIALYLIVTHPKGLSGSLSAAGSGASGLVKAFQGR